MHVLITNDDGILAPGIVALADALKKIAKVTVVAPDRNNSAVSSGLSLEKPLRITQVRENWYQVNGTPADCVKLALSGFLTEEPDIVVSGINAGQNLGDDVIYSGTVGAALEGRFLKMPPIAISCAGDFDEELNYEAASYVAVELVKRMMENPLESAGYILNVNVPNIPYKDLEGIAIVRQGNRDFSEPMILTEDGRGRPIYWMGEVGRILDGGAGTDFGAVNENYASVTPMQTDLTDHSRISPLQKWLGQ